MTQNPALFIDRFAHLDWSMEQKLGAVEVLMHMAQAFVDWCWDGKSALRKLGIASDFHAAARPDRVEWTDTEPYCDEATSGPEKA